MSPLWGKDAGASMPESVAAKPELGETVEAGYQAQWRGRTQAESDTQY